MHWLSAVALGLGLLGESCLRPSEERAERDLGVGRAETEQIRVEVSEGLAAIRALSSSGVTLWGSAPMYDFTLHNAATAPLAFGIELQNCLADGQLFANDSASAEPSTDGEAPTRKSFSMTLAPGTTRFRWRAPDAADPRPFRFGLLSDVQEAIDRVSDVYDRINAEPGLRFLLGAGDLTEQGEREELERFQTELLRLRLPYFTTLGNHELGQTPTKYHDYFGRGNFQFEFRGVTFTLLDSASATIDPQVYDWLEDWLTRGRGRTHIVAMHIPPFDPMGVRNGAFGSRAEAAKLVSRLARGGVDLTLYGHVHSFYAFDNAGIPAFISGGGGAIPERFDAMGRHFMVIEDDANSVRDARVVRVAGD